MRAPCRLFAGILLTATIGVSGEVPRHPRFGFPVYTRLPPGKQLSGEHAPAITPPRSPEEAQRRFRLPPGFEIRLFDSEPDVVNPVAISWDERGRLWVLELDEYPMDGPAGHTDRDRIKILGDTRTTLHKILSNPATDAIKIEVIHAVGALNADNTAQEVISNSNIQSLLVTENSAMPEGLENLPDADFRILLWHILAPPQDGKLLTPQRRQELINAGANPAS